MKIRLIGNDNKVVCTSENTDILSILSIENVEIQIKKENKLLIFRYENSAYNVTENLMDIYLNLIDVDDLNELNEIHEYKEFEEKDLEAILEKWSIR